MEQKTQEQQILNDLTNHLNNLSLAWETSEQKDYLQLFLDCIHCQDNLNPDHFTKRKVYYITKFLKLCVLQIFEKFNNNAILIFNSAEACGKTTLIRWLFSSSDIFHQYYYEISSKLSFLNFSDLLKNNFFINFDNFNNFSTSLTTYKPFLHHFNIEQYDKITKKTNWIGASDYKLKLPNTPNILQQLIIIEIKQINFDYIKIPIGMLWGQITFLAKKDLAENNLDNLTYNNDYKKLRNFNIKYLLNY